MYAQPCAPQDVEDGGSQSLEDVPLSTTVSEKAKEAKSSSNNPQWGAMDLDAYQENLQLRAPQSYPDEGFRAPHSVQADVFQRQAYRWPSGQTPEAEEMQVLQMQVEREQLLSQQYGEGAQMPGLVQDSDRDVMNSIRSPQLYHPKVDRRYFLD